MTDTALLAKQPTQRLMWRACLLYVCVISGSLTLSACTELSAALAPSSPAAVLSGSQTCKIGEPFTRTELLFGRARPGGLPVTDTEWQSFLEQIITPRFPEGLTVLMGRGQFRDQQDILIREDSILLILLYPGNTGERHQRIEHIREAYKHVFQQQSVLRLDTTACVSF